MSDAREEMREAIRRGLRTANPHTDPELREDCIDEVMRNLMESADNQIGWLILGNVEHVYRVQASKMTDTTWFDQVRWNITTRFDQ